MITLSLERDLDKRSNLFPSVLIKFVHPPIHPKIQLLMKPIVAFLGGMNTKGATN